MAVVAHTTYNSPPELEVLEIVNAWNAWQVACHTPRSETSDDAYWAAHKRMQDALIAVATTFDLELAPADTEAS